MGLFKRIKKFGKSVAKTVVHAVPSAAAGFVTAGPAGAALGALGSLQPRQGIGGTLSPGTGIFGGLQTSYGGAYGIPGDYGGMQPVSNGQVPMPVSSGAVQLTESLFNLILKLGQAVGHSFKSAGGVHRWGRMMIAKLLRFARANPGLTVLNLLINLGFTAIEANELLTWWATSGKKHRRIKVTNIKALNRSVRRLEGFRRLSHRVEAALSRRGAPRALTVRRRCPRCRKSPCCC